MSFRAAGFFLSLTHLVTALHWGPPGGFLPGILVDTRAFCWPFFSSCETTRSLIVPTWPLLVGIYGLISLGACAAFAWGRRPRLALAAAWAALTIKLAIEFQDYRLGGNFHYMSNLASLVFLIWPRRRDTLLALIVSFYVAAGLLKFNREWLEGWALIRPTFLHGAWLKAACAYVICLELVVVFGLLNRRATIFWGAFAQLVIFHLFSWHIVGYFYPLIMLCLLAWVAAERVLNFRFEPRNVLWPVIAAFFLAQGVPLLIPGDAAITGEGRLFSASMLDAYVECRAFFIAGEGSTRQDISEDFRNIGVRLGCDPLVVWNRARDLCRSNPKLEVALYSKLRHEENYRVVVSESDFCNAGKDYRIFARNSWIQANPESSDHVPLPVLNLGPALTANARIEMSARGRVVARSPAGALSWTAAVGDTAGERACHLKNGQVLIPVRDIDAYGQAWQGRVVALRESDGAALWRGVTLSSRLPTLDCEISSPGRFFAHDEDGFLWSIDSASGRVMWARQMPTAIIQIRVRGERLEIKGANGFERRLLGDNGFDAPPEALP